MTVNTPILEVLHRAADGLLFPSETDAPLVPFFWPDERPSTPTPGLLREKAGVAPDAKIKSVRLETFFRPATREEEWHNAGEKAEVARFQELAQTLRRTLRGVKVFRVGETEIAVYIVGKVEGGWAGLRTCVVES